MQISLKQITNIWLLTIPSSGTVLQDPIEKKEIRNIHMMILGDVKGDAEHLLKTNSLLCPATFESCMFNFSKWWQNFWTAAVLGVCLCVCVVYDPTRDIINFTRNSISPTQKKVTYSTITAHSATPVLTVLTKEILRGIMIPPLFQFETFRGLVTNKIKVISQAHPAWHTIMFYRKKWLKRWHPDREVDWFKLV